MYRKNVHNKRARRGRSGFALVLVLITVAVAVVLGMSYVSSASVKLVSSRNHLQAARAKYLAESGLQHALYVMWGDRSSIEGTSATHPLGPFQADGTTDAYEFWAVRDPYDIGLYTVTARATIGGVSQTSSLKVYRSPPYSDLIMSESPAGYWRLGEQSGTEANDSSGHDYGLTSYNGVSTGQEGALTADADTAAGFDGVNDYLYRPPTSDLQIRGDLTVSLWFKLDQLPTGTDKAYLLTCSEEGESPTDNASYELTIDSAGSVGYLQEFGSGNDQSHVFTGLNLAANTWQNLVITRNQVASTIVVYLAGQQVASWTYGSPGPPKPNSGKNAGFYVGSAWGGGSFFDGSMDELAVFNETLSAAEIQAIHDAGAATNAMEVRSWDR
jgi:hypothetical protein